MNSDILVAIAASASAVAAICSVVVTFFAPMKAAEKAERLRIENDRSQQLKAQKLFIFYELMKARGVQITRESVAAMNLIDLVFLDSKSVKDAWADLYSAYSARGDVLPLASDKLKNLLKEIALDIGLDAKLGVSDLERYYYPDAIANEDRVREQNIAEQMQARD